ncbi:hypothetical protein ACTHGU_09785 [Chitinophagaceae bacterium MMS25-I14]
MKQKFTIATFLLAVAGLLLSGCSTYCDTCPNVKYTSCIIADIIITLLVAAVILLGLYSNLLRDEVNDCDQFNHKLRQIQSKTARKIQARNPYSISKVQLAVWTLVIGGSYLHLVLCKINCEIMPINKTALVLMGISAGTAAAATIVDKRQIQDGNPRHQNRPSKGFFTDILSDDNGISIHRLQKAVWTLIATVIYLHKVYIMRDTQPCELPELGDTLLALTGISNATYLVLKSKENDPPVNAPVQTPDPGTDPDPANTPPPNTFS